MLTETIAQNAGPATFATRETSDFATFATFVCYAGPDYIALRDGLCFGEEVVLRNAASAALCTALRLLPDRELEPFVPTFLDCRQVRLGPEIDGEQARYTVSVVWVRGALLVSMDTDQDDELETQFWADRALALDPESEAEAARIAGLVRELPPSPWHFA
jgi:hypothetical protein